MTLASSTAKVLGLGVASVAATCCSALLYSRHVVRAKSIAHLKEEGKRFLPELQSQSKHLDMYHVNVKLQSGVQFDEQTLLTAYMQAFFTCGPFQLERMILKLAGATKMPSDEEIYSMKFDNTGIDCVGPFQFIKRNKEAPEALFEWSEHGKTWFGVSHYDPQACTVEVQFGSVLMNGLPSSFLFAALMPFHLIYSQVLVAAASRKLVSDIEQSVSRHI